MRKKMRLKKNNVYIVRVPGQVQELLSDLKIVSEGFIFTTGINKDIITRQLLQTCLSSRGIHGWRLCQ